MNNGKYNLGTYLGNSEYWNDLTEQKAKDIVWTLMMSSLVLPCFIAFWIQNRPESTESTLGGRETIKTYLAYNRAALAVMLVTFAIYIVILVRHAHGRKDSMIKVLTLAGAGIIVAFCTLFIFLGARNVYRDYKSPVECAPQEYVLSMSDGSFFVAFEDQGEYAQLEIPREIFDKLSDGERIDDTSHSNIYNLVSGRNYLNVKLYAGNGVKITYYFYSVIYENAEFPKSSDES